MAGKKTLQTPNGIAKVPKKSGMPKKQGGKKGK